MKLRAHDLTWREIDGDLVILDLRSSTYLTTNASGKFVTASTGHHVAFIAAQAAQLTVDGVEGPDVPGRAGQHDPALEGGGRQHGEFLRPLGRDPIGDQTRGEGLVRTLAEQVALEARTRVLNPKWYEGMLEHGYEGVRQIEAHVTNTMGWSATTGQVAPWIYQQLTQTFVLDEAMRERLATLNPKASAKVASRLIEAHERQYWSPDEATLAALRDAGEALEDRLEGISDKVAA